MSDQDFVWPPPSDDLDQFEIVDLVTGRSLPAPPPGRMSVEPQLADRAAAAVGSSDHLSNGPPASDRAEAPSPREFTWPPIADLDDAMVTLDAASPWADAGFEGGWTTSGATRVEAGEHAGTWEFPNDALSSLTADRPSRMRLPVWTRWAAAVLICGVVGTAIERHLRSGADVVTKHTVARAEAGDGNDATLPSPWRRGAPTRASGEVSAGPVGPGVDGASYALTDLRSPRGLGDDRGAGSKAFLADAAREPQPMPVRGAAGEAHPSAPVLVTALATSQAPAPPISPVSAPPTPALDREIRDPLVSAPAPSVDAARAPQTTVAFAGPTAAAPPAPAADASAARGVRDEVRIEATLDRYRTAYASLDAAAARSVWPSVDQRKLERAFGSLKSQGLDFESCATDVQGADATVACRGRATYVPRIGSQRPRTEEHQWRFRLRKVDESWMIVNAEAS
jgi:hypothetical protein